MIAGESRENIVMQEIQNSIKASSVHLFLIQYAYRGERKSPPGISVETYTLKDSLFEKMAIGDVID